MFKVNNKDISKGIFIVNFEHKEIRMEFLLLSILFQNIEFNSITEEQIPVYRFVSFQDNTKLE